MFETFSQDVRYAFRSLTRRPGVTAVAGLSLALGIGVNTAIFSIFERVLLRRLPVPAPDEIVHVTSPGPRPGGASTDDGGGRDHVFSYPLFRDLEGLENTGLAHIAAHRGFAANLAYDGRTERAEGLIVSGGYFPALGLVPEVGRLFTPADDVVAGGHPVAVLAHRYWTTRFAADPGVIGDTLIINDQAMTIVGVAPAGFSGTVIVDTPQVVVPLAMRAQMRAGADTRRDHWLYLFGRLAPGVTRERAQTLLSVPFAGLIRDVEYPVQRSGLGDAERQQFLARQIVLEEGARGREANRDQTRTVLVLFMAVTGLVLLIACANLANLMLARAADRSAEIGMRLALGASPASVIRLFMTEATLLGVLGAIGALIVGYAAAGVILSILPPEDAARMPFEVNSAILLFSLALGLGASVLFGLLPAVHSVRATIAGAVAGQPGRASQTRSAARFRAVLATAQIALATALLAEAGLFLSSLGNVARSELGIQREGLIGFRLLPFLNGYTPERTATLVATVTEGLRGVPGVGATTVTTIPLLADNGSTNFVIVEGFEPRQAADARASYALVGVDYFRTLGIPLLAGRDFSSADFGSAAKVAIVNEAFVRAFNLGGQPVGKRMARGRGDIPIDIEIIGVVRDAKYSQVREPAPPQFFLPYKGEPAALTFYARTSSDERQLRSVIPAIVQRLDPNLPVERLRTMDEQIWDNVTRDRVLATLSSIFAGLAVALAGIGLYAVLAYTVARRLREIGVRIALGADTGRITRLVFGQMTRMAATGAAVGCAGALALGRLARSLLFGVDALDPAVLAAAAVGVVLVSVTAALLPAYRAAQVDPAVTLRAE